MKIKTLLLPALTSLGLFSTLAHADDSVVNIVNGGNIQFTGKFVNAACAVSLESENKVAELGQYRTAALTSAAQNTTNIPFDIKLTDCDPEVSKTAQIGFNGVADSDDSTLFSVNSSGNSKAATGVGIEILDAKQKVLSPNGDYSNAQALIAGDNTFNFLARYKSTAATVTAGQANADATFLVRYE